MKKYYLVHSTLFKNYEVRVKCTWIEVENFTTMLHNLGFDADYSLDNNQKDE